MLGWLVMGALGATWTTVDAGRGPVRVAIPAGAGATAQPLVLNFHGYSGTSHSQEAYTGFLPLVDTEGFVYAAPDGDTDWFGLQYWNATDYCCDLFGAGPDDVTYVLDLIDAISAITPVDPQHVTLTGHSNGGFLSHAVACEHPDRIAAIASLAGANHDDPADCAATEAVHMLQIHGSQDTTIRAGGDCTGGACYPSVKDTVATWRDINGCVGAPTLTGSLDLDASVGGAETDTAYQACDPAGSVAVWAMWGSGHVPWLTSAYAENVLDFLLAHPKP